MAKTPPSNLAYVPGVTKVPHTENVNSTKSNSNNVKTTQVEGHLAPPQTLPIKFKQHNNNTNGTESGDDDAHGRLLTLLYLIGSFIDILFFCR